MACFQTRVAELLPVPDYARISWRALGLKIGVEGATLKRWYEASVGSGNYLDVIDASVLNKVAQFCDVNPGEVVVLVTDDGQTIPLALQETAIAAAIAPA